jgi:hypothetical protein
MKKSYNLKLDEDVVEALDRWLDAAGMTRSGYINTLMTKTVESMGLKDVPDYGELKVTELFKMLGSVGDMMEGVKRKKRK